MSTTTKYSSKKITAPPKKEIEEYYNQYGVSISDVARKYNTSNPTVRKWMIEYGIKRKTQKQASRESNDLKSNKIPEKKELQRLYDDFCSVIDLAKYLNVNVERLKSTFREYGIKQLSLSESVHIAKKKSWEKRKPPKEKVVEIYRKYRNLSATANHFSMSVNSIKKVFDEYGIKIQYGQRSQKEIELFEWCESLNEELMWVSNDRSVIPPFELDMYCSQRNIAIEYNGVYWHSQSGPNNIDSGYHQRKWKMCKDAGITLITVFETDDIEKIKRLIEHKVSQKKSIGARKCKVQKISSNEAKNFHTTWHINGSVGASHHYGIFYQDELLQVVSFSKSRFNKNYEFECARNSIGDTPIQGGTSKLFKAFFREVGNVSLISYADLRFGDGSVYGHCGLSYNGISKPNYFYFNKNNITHGLQSRIKYQKHKLKDVLPVFDPNKTEYENMLMNDFDRVFDCGNAIWMSK